MENLKLDTGRKTLAVEFDGKKKKEYFFYIGDYEAMRLWADKAAIIQDLAQRLEKKPEDKSAIEDALALEKEVVCMVLGEKAWKEIYTLAHRNIFAIMQLVVMLSRMMKEGVEAGAKAAQRLS